MGWFEDGAPRNDIGRKPNLPERWRLMSYTPRNENTWNPPKQVSAWKTIDSKVPNGRGYVSYQEGKFWWSVWWVDKVILEFSSFWWLVGGFNPIKKKSNMIISPSRGEHKNYLKPPPSWWLMFFDVFFFPEIRRLSELKFASKSSQVIQSTFRAK